MQKREKKKNTAFAMGCIYTVDIC